MPIVDKSNNNEMKEYIEFLRTIDNASFMQDPCWGKIKKTWDKEYVYLKRNEKIVAGMTLLIKKIPHINRSLIYCPRGPVCDGNNVDLLNNLIAEATPIIRKYKAFLVKFDPQIIYNEDSYKWLKELKNNRFHVNRKTSSLIQPKYNMVIDLRSKSKEDVLKSFSSKTRYNIKYSVRKNIKVYYSNSEEDLKRFYDTYLIMCKRNHIESRDYSYFKNMLDSFDKKYIRIYIAYHEDDILSAAIALNYGGELNYLYGASNNIKRNLMPNYSMQWEMIKWGIETNCHTYNLGGLLKPDMTNGLYRFKIGFSTKEGIKEYIGEVDKIYNYPIYLLYSKGLPIFRMVNRKLKHLKTK